MNHKPEPDWSWLSRTIALAIVALFSFALGVLTGKSLEHHAHELDNSTGYIRGLNK